MPVDPFIEPLLAQLPPFPDTIDDFPAFREQEGAGAEALVQQLAEPGPEIRSQEVVSIPVEAGTIDLKIFRPFGEGPHPVHIYIHGGGWVGGTIHSSFIDIVGQERAHGAACVVVAVEYRKAPEHPFPTALNDCYTALRWVADNAAELGVRTDLITVGGGSAGANLAAALTLKVRDEGGPSLTFQLLEVPCLDLTLRAPSYQTYGAGYGLDLTTIDKLRDYYLPSPSDAENPYVSPLLAPDLSGLPPAHIMSAEYEPVRDDGELYAQRLVAAGVPATFSLGLGHIHVSPAFTKVMASARAWRDEAVSVLRTAHQAPPAA